MVGECGDGIEREVELVLSVELEVCLGECVILLLCVRVFLGKICGVCSDLVGN